MDVTISREMERLERRLLFLATVGSTAPFVGLFGTVWGIMTSFQAIAQIEEHQPRRRGAGHRRGAVRHRTRPARGDPGGDRLQQVRCRFRTLASGWKRSPTSSPPSFRARSTSALRGASSWVRALARRWWERP
jgi:hypothetical protein